MIELKRILLPTDFSEYATEATKYALALAEKFGSEVHLLHVIDLMAAVAPEYGIPPWLDEQLEKMEAQALERLGEVFEPAWREQHRTVRATRQGTTYAKIIEYAKEHQIDLIVMGTHGRSGLTHFLMGSVAERVVRHASCPVLTVRPVAK